jgi:hypothetical protein
VQEWYAERDTSSEKIGPKRIWNKEPGKDEKRLWKGPECKIGINDPGTRLQLHLKTERTSDGHDRKASRLQFVKRSTAISSWLRKVTRLVEERPPPKRMVSLLAYSA